MTPVSPVPAINDTNNKRYMFGDNKAVVTMPPSYFHSLEEISSCSLSQSTRSNCSRLCPVRLKGWKIQSHRHLDQTLGFSGEAILLTLPPNQRRVTDFNKTCQKVRDPGLIQYPAHAMKKEPQRVVPDFTIMLLLLHSNSLEWAHPTLPTYHQTNITLSYSVS